MQLLFEPLKEMGGIRDARRGAVDGLESRNRTGPLHANTGRKLGPAKERDEAILRQRPSKLVPVRVTSRSRGAGHPSAVAPQTDDVLSGALKVP